MNTRVCIFIVTALLFSTTGKLQCSPRRRLHFSSRLRNRSKSPADCKLWSGFDFSFCQFVTSYGWYFISITLKGGVFMGLEMLRLWQILRTASSVRMPIFYLSQRPSWVDKTDQMHSICMILFASWILLFFFIFLCSCTEDNGWLDEPTRDDTRSEVILAS